MLPSLPMLLRWLVCVAAMAFALAACADGFAPSGDDDDDKFDEVELGSEATAEAPDETVAPTVTPPAASAPTPRATATPAPTPTSTPVPTPTATPTPTPTPTPVPTPTPTPTPMFPPEFIGDPVRGVIGEVTNVEAIATDADGEIVAVDLLEADDTLFVVDGRTLRFIPTEAGTTRARVRVTDDQGLSTLGDVVFLARYRGHPQALVGLGDSVPAGHGLDLADYLGGDPCWRAPNSFPRRVFNQLVADGIFGGQGEFALLACSGYDVDDLWEREVTGGFSDVRPASGRRSQLDWTVRSNPRFVTLTIGANDTGFVGPGQLFLDDGVSLDRDQVDRRMFVIERDLRVALDRLIDATDATVFVTNYYNPTAERPQGIPTCRLECFREKADEVVGRMNEIIERVAREYDDTRVVFVDVATSFVGKGAPNGIGLDSAREAGFGELGEVLGADQIAGVHPYCARGDTVGESWINPVDCVHPDERGTAEMASIVVAAIREHLGANPDA